MDISTVLGLFLGIFFVLLAIFMGGSASVFINVPSLLIVIGGTIATTFLKFPMTQVLSTISVTKKAFFSKLQQPGEIISRLTELSQIGRKEGILALESVEISDKFLHRGIQYCVDGWETEFIVQILQTDISFSCRRHETGKEIFKGMGKYAPAFGMLGTLIGLVQMLTAMDNPRNIGPAMAVALLTTFYGALIANVIALPLADKLEIRSKEERLLKELMLEGIKSIKEGDTPRNVEQKLYAFLPPNLRQEAG